MFLQHLPQHVKDEMVRFMCGKELGRGISRTVFEYAFDPKFVLKIEHNQHRNQNASEYIFWDHICDLPKAQKQIVQPWFARVAWCSSTNSILMQERTQPVTLDELRANVPKVPMFLSDLKVGNWGRIGKRYVCHDYGTALIAEHGLYAGAKLRRADWWE